MLTTKIYEDENGTLAAIVLKDGQYDNYILGPEIFALEGEGFFEEAQIGFSEAGPYEKDSMIGLTMEEAAAKEEQNSTLIAEVGEKTTIYPRRMSQDRQEFFQIILGDDVWEELLAQVSGNEGVQLDL